MKQNEIQFQLDWMEALHLLIVVGYGCLQPYRSALFNSICSTVPIKSQLVWTNHKMKSIDVMDRWTYELLKLFHIYIISW